MAGISIKQVEDGEHHAVPGRRFVGRWERRHAQRMARPNAFERFWRLALGILVLLAAIPIGAIPGPGGAAVTLAGLYLLAGEVRWIARLLDWAELRLRPFAIRAYDWWMRPRVRTARVIVAVSLVIPLAVLLVRAAAHPIFVVWAGASALLLLLDVLVLAATGAVRLTRPRRH